MIVISVISRFPVYISLFHLLRTLVSVQFQEVLHVAIDIIFLLPVL